MRNFGNAIRNFYGELTINSLSGVGLTVNGTSTNTAIGANPTGSLGTGLAVVGPSATATQFISMQQLGQTAWIWKCNASTNDLLLYSSTLAGNVLDIAGAGNVTINAPSSGQSLTINGVAQTGYGPAAKILAPNTTGQSNGLTISAGTNSSDAPLVIQNAANSNYFAILGDGSWSFSKSGATTVACNANGGVSIAAPSSGTALTVSAVNGALAEQIYGGTTSAQSYGIAITAGTTSTDYNLYAQNAAGTQSLFLVRGDGGVIVGGTTGDQGYGTLNALNGLYVNGSAVYSGIPQNAQGGASYTLAASDNGKHVWVNRAGSSTITVPSGVFAVGNSITIVYDCTVAGSLVGSGVTIYWFPSNSTGTRTLGLQTLCTLLCVQTNVFVLTGTGLS